MLKTEDLKKLLKENKICFYSYWTKKKIIEIARINKLISETKPITILPTPKIKQEPETETKPEPKPEVKPDPIQQLRLNRFRPISVKIIDIETKEEKSFNSLYKASKYLNNAPQTISDFGRKKGIWRNKYQIII